MIICPDKKLAFVHVYKTGGTSITHLLAPHTDPRFRLEEARLRGSHYQRTWHYKGNQHAHYEEYASELTQTLPDWKDFQVLTVARNPYDWVISIYKNFYLPTVYRKRGPRARFQAAYPERGFLDFLSFMTDANSYGEIGRLPQTYFIAGVPPEQLVIVHFERLAEELPGALAPIGISGAELPHENPSKSRDVPVHALRESRELIEYCNRFMEADFKRFGYEPETA